jgi:hypothetical protein
MKNKLAINPKQKTGYTLPQKRPGTINQATTEELMVPGAEFSVGSSKCPMHLVTVK